ncbi:unnamed protein product [Echinostoma caproni]|uniref:XRE family transcriptional regulator n=1 Tax=Echinostoma caproni TaxID=27848 RepID=A0A183A0X8_9TREM|nr:unnamed protein product [Echinostoma caproni]
MKYTKYEYEKKLARDIKTNPKRVLAYVQSKGLTCESVGTLGMANGNIASTDSDRAETLMDYFKSVYRSSQGNGVRNPMVDNTGNELQMLILNDEDV